MGTLTRCATRERRIICLCICLLAIASSLPQLLLWFCSAFAIFSWVFTTHFIVWLTCLSTTIVSNDHVAFVNTSYSDVCAWVDGPTFSRVVITPVSYLDSR